MELKAVEIVKPDADINVIIGQSHFIKTVETFTKRSCRLSPE